jgi:hypothetical protein
MKAMKTNSIGSTTAEGTRGDRIMARNRNLHRSGLFGTARAALVLMSLAVLTACGDFTGGDDPTANPLAGGGAAPSGVSEAEQIQFFSQTLWPVLNGNTCGGCHSVAGGRPFALADPDIALAYRTLVNNSKINFGTPSASRVYVQVAANSHNCWTNDCQADSAIILQQIQAWITLIENAGGSSTGGQAVGQQGTLLSDQVAATNGVEDVGGERVTTNMIAFWRFDEKTGTVARDTSGVPPAMDITLGLDTIFMDSYGIDFSAGTASASTAASRKLYDHIADPTYGTGQYSIEMWLVPANTNQMADMLRYSNDIRVRQRLYQYDLRNRSTAPSIPSGNNGVAQLVTYDQDRDLQAGMQHMVMTWDRFNGMKIFVNGVDTGDVDAFTGGQLWNWATNSRLTLGNSGDTGWFGQIRMLAIYRAALKQDQILQNFRAGVGLRLTLSFDISQFAGAGSRIEMSLSQLDDQSYLLCAPTIITGNVGIRVRGMRVRVNGSESPVGQAFSRLNTIVTSSRQQISSQCTMVENLPGPETFQLAFEGLGQWLDPVTPTVWPPITYDYAGAEVLPTNGIRDFARVNETMSTLTNVPTDVPTVEATFTDVMQQLPGAADLRTFVSSQQVGIAKLALDYCSELVDDTVERDLFFDQGPVFEWNAVPATAFLNNVAEDKRLRITGPLVDKMMGVGLAVQPDANVVEARLLGLIDALVSDCGSCDGLATRNIVKGTCTAMLASGTVQMH